MTELLTLQCPSCGTRSSQVPASLAGRKVRCTACRSIFVASADFVASGEAPAAPRTLEVQDTAAPTLAEADLDLTGAVVAAATAPETATRPSSETTSAEWRKGELILGLYEVVETLGEGGMGRVYRVRHRGWGLDLAMKVPLAAVLEAAGGADLFEREAETWVNLGLHPHVITCHYVRRVAGVPLVFAEYANGGSLHDAIRAGKLNTLESVLDVAIQIAWGLHHAHERGLVHRDVKPANVMLTTTRFAKVTDFGLARSRGGRLKAPTAAAAGHTMTVEGGGGATPAYVSPEQARGETLNRRADVWSYALSVLEMFTGGRTWQFGLAAPEALESYRRDSSRSERRPQMPDRLADLLQRCFREQADERPHDLLAVAAELQEIWQAAVGRPYGRHEPRGDAGSADSLNNRAASLVDLGRATEAASLWRRALQVEPHHVAATYNALLADWTAADIADPELLRRMEEACSSHPDSARARQLAGRLQLALLQQSEALAAFERAASLGPLEDLAPDQDRARKLALAPEQTLPRLAAAVSALASTPDRKTLVAGGGGEIRVFDTSTGQTTRTIIVEGGAIRALLLTPDAQCAIVAVEGAPIAVFELASGRLLRSFARQTGFATCLAELPDGFILSGGSDRVVRVWEAASGRCVRELGGHEDAVSAVAAGSSTMASAGRDGGIRVWSTADGRCLATLRPQGGRVLALALSEAQSRLVAASEDGLVRDFGLRSRTLVRSYASHAQTVQALALTPDGARIISGSTDRTLRGFDTDGERLFLLRRFDSGVQAITGCRNDGAFVAHGQLVSRVRWAPLEMPPLALCRPASAVDEEARSTFFEERLNEARRSLAAGDLGSAFHQARAARSIAGRERARAALEVWDELCARLPRQALLSAWEEARLEGHEEAVLSVALDATRSRAATSSLDGTVRVRTLGTRSPDLVLRGHEGAVTAVAFLPGAAQLLSSGRDHTLRLWDAASGTALATLEGHAETVADVDVAPDGLRAASAGWDGVVRIWDLRSRAVKRVLEGHGANVACVRFSGDGQVLASGGWDGSARLWDAESGASLAVLSGHGGNVTALALHPAGRQVATGCDDHAIRLFDPRSSRAPRVLTGHQGEVTGLAFTADGRFLASSSRDRSVRVWDVRRGEPVRSLAHPGVVLGLALASGGSLLASACADRTARLWHLDWQPEAAVDPASLSGPYNSVRSVTSAGTSVRLSTLRADLRRTKGPVKALTPKAGVAVRRVPWRWVALAAAVLVASLISLRAWHPAAPRLRLSPQAAQSTADGIDVIDLGRFTAGCVAEEYATHLARLQAGTPDAYDVACVAMQNAPSTVSDVLDAAPLTAEDPLAGLRLRRNAASALTALSDDALTALCERIGDENEEKRSVVMRALGAANAAAANDCLKRQLLGGSPTATKAAAGALSQRIARGVVPVADSWALVRRLLDAPDPQARLAGLALAPLFSAGTSLPAVLALTKSPDPGVADAARQAAKTIEATRHADQLLGDVDP